MTTYIDMAGLAPDLPIGREYVESLGLSGELLPADERMACLLNLLQEGDRVITGPGEQDFWLLAPGTVGVEMYPDGTELPRNNRAESVLEWQLRLRGIGRSEALKWVKKPPTDRHSKHSTYVEALQETHDIENHPYMPIKTLDHTGETFDEEVPYEYTIITDGSQYANFIDSLRHAVRTATVVGYDVESDTRGKKGKKGRRDPDPRKDVLVGMAFSFSEESNWYLPLNGPLNSEAIIEGIQPYMELLIWVGTNAQYDYCVSRNAGVMVKAATGDSQCASMLLQRKDRGLKANTMELWGVEQEDFIALLDAHNATCISEVPLESAGKYAAGDAYWVQKNVEELERRIEIDPAKTSTGQQTLSQLYHTIEMPVHRILNEMTMTGVRLDLQGITDRTTQVRHKKEAIKRELQGICGPDFNPGSPADVSHQVFTVRKHPVQSLTDSRLPSTSELDLLRIKYRDPYFIQLILLYRHYQKQEGTLLPWLKFHHDARLRSVWNQYLTKTGRISTKDPNQNNLPLSLRDLFLVDVVADYSQLEMRILAFTSKCDAMVQVFREGGDMHDTTCQRIFGLPAGASKDPANYSSRVAGKAANFAAGAYGAEGSKLREIIEKQALREVELDITVPSIAECQGIVNEWKKAYPEVVEHKERVWTFVRERGYAQTLFGRRQRYDDINSADGEKRAAAERESYNLGIQGSAGDLVKEAMVLVEKIPRGQIIIQNHDELCVDLDIQDYQERLQYVERMKAAMELGQPLNKGQWGVELVCDPVLVRNWKEAK